MYLLRLDDASEYMDTNKWSKISYLLDRYGIKPIVGVIPDNRDELLLSKYKYDAEFWDLVKIWREKGWTIALHGCTHVYGSDDGGINPVFNRSEFAGLPLAQQRHKIRSGIDIFKENGIVPKAFFAPSHTFDENTLLALELESNIRVIIDTIAMDVYFKDGFHFVPQQTGKVRRLPFKVVTFCYHPNTMRGIDFVHLEEFIHKYQNRFGSFEDLHLIDRELAAIDYLLKGSYFIFRKMRSLFRAML